MKVFNAVFPVFTLLVGIWATQRTEWLRWRRDWLVQRIKDTQAYFGEALEAIDDQHRVSGQAADAVLQIRAMPPQERFDSATQRWNRVLARSGVSASPEVQAGLYAFDKVRNDIADVINTKDQQAIPNVLQSIEAAYLAVKAAMKSDQDEINEELGRYFVSGPQRAWHTLTGQRFGPPTQPIDQ